ncbi:hypothetical protein KK141_11825 [Dyella sp. LX-66]|nr:pentapeptide repeat-containing protein [Dyella sp. LX-66]MBT2140220.1 hypothetical protein [Dyella sp. LX-66]
MTKTPSRELVRLLRERKVFNKQTLSGESFRGERWPDFIAISSTFNFCNFSNTQFEQACFGGGMNQSRYVNCCFDDAEIDANAPGNARFERCTFLNTKIREFRGVNVEFIDCIFSGVIKNGFFNGTPHRDTATPPLSRTQNEFHGNDFSNAELINIGFRSGIDLSLQRLPKGDDYIYVEDGRRFVQNLPSTGLAEKHGDPFSVIEHVLEMELAEEQRQIFLSIKGFPARDRPMLMDLKRIAEGKLLA